MGSGEANSRHTPATRVVAKVAPRSLKDRRTGPTTLIHEYGPVAVAEVMLAQGVRIDHGPKRAASSAGRTSTQAVAGRTPNRVLNGAIAGSKRKGKRRVPVGAAGAMTPTVTGPGRYPVPDGAVPTPTPPGHSLHG